MKLESDMINDKTNKAKEWERIIKLKTQNKMKRE